MNRSCVILQYATCSVYFISNDVSSEVERTGEEVVMVCFKVFLFCFPGGIEENHETSL
jgi:hypothetical protein